jgi:NAD(P)-dependent dehydrogenase (short-subunit alcohol dehydrogenase family)
MIRALEGRNAIITGASQGFGLAIARAYVQAGASVLLCARDAALLGQARAEVASSASAGQRVLAMAADVSRQGDVDQLGAAALEAFSQVHILINNAGVYGPLGPIEEIDWAAWVHAIEINLFGSILMCRALLPHFKKHRYGKIVQLSGGGATNPLPRFSAYAASKTAVVRFVETLAEEVRDAGIDVNAIAPGALNTRLLDEVLEGGPARVGRTLYDRALKQREQGGAPMEPGTRLAVFLGAAVSDGITAKLLSALWDPWQALPAHLDDLRKTDVYTLRRIVPADRALAWGSDRD